jgi:magnesium-dependent phosphatase 1
MEAKNPAVAVFDLDFTLWPLDVDCMRTPFALARGGGAVSADGDTLAPYPEASACLASLFDAGVRIAYASRTHDPAAAEALLKLLPLPSRRPGLTLWDALRGERELFQAYPSRGGRAKADHFARIAAASGEPFSAMVFYDDMPDNISEAEKQGTVSTQVSGGLTLAALREGLGRWRERYGGGGGGGGARAPG